MKTISWLHISDLHFRVSHDYDASIVLQALLRDIEERMRYDGLHPDFIVVTGDVAFSGKSAEYSLAQCFFDNLLRVTDLSKDRLFLIPGNHDVDRGLISLPAKATASVLIDRDSTNQILANPQNRHLMLARFKGYATFINDYLGEYLSFDDKHYFFVRALELAGYQIAVLGLNSAWLAGSDADHGHLLLGERQVREALAASKDADLRLSMMHHPFEWLQEFDRDDCEALLAHDCDFILHGHMHKLSLLQTRDPDKEAFIIAAGACYETRKYPNIYNFVQLDPSTGQGTVHLRTYSDRRGGFWTKDTVSYRNVSNGVYSFALKRRIGTKLAYFGTQLQTGIAELGLFGTTPDTEVIADIKRKLQSDYEKSLLDSQRSTCDSLDRIRFRMSGIFEGVHSQSSSEMFKACTSDLDVSQVMDSSIYSGRQATVDHENLKWYTKIDEIESIRVSVACNSSSAVIAVMTMAQWALRHEYAIKVDFGAPAGKYQLLQAYRSTVPFHAIIVGSPAFSFSQYAKFDELGQQLYTGETSEYVLALPIHGESQVLLVPKGMEDQPVQRIYSPNRSATEEPHRTGEFRSIAASGSIPCLSETYEVVLKDPLSFIMGETPMEKGSGMTIWAPTYSSLCSIQRLTRVPEFSYDHLIGMFIQRNLVLRYPKVATSLCGLFVAAWNYCRLNPEHRVRVLTEDRTYIESFAFSSGSVAKKS